jgi:hypothetical protein
MFCAVWKELLSLRHVGGFSLAKWTAWHPFSHQLDGGRSGTNERDPTRHYCPMDLKKQHLTSGRPTTPILTRSGFVFVSRTSGDWPAYEILVSRMGQYSSGASAAGNEVSHHVTARQRSIYRITRGVTGPRAFLCGVSYMLSQRLERDVTGKLLASILSLAARGPCCVHPVPSCFRCGVSYAKPILRLSSSSQKLLLVPRKLGSLFFFVGHLRSFKDCGRVRPQR